MLPILEGLSSTGTRSPKFANYDFTDLSPAVEMRNWLLREFEVALPIIELLSIVSLQQLSLKVFGGSKLLELNHTRP